MEEQNKYKTPEEKRRYNAEYRRNKWATDPIYREACKAKQKRREQSDEYKAKRRAKYRAAHPIVTERQRIMTAAFERRRTGVPNYHYTPQPEQFKKQHGRGKLRDVSDARDKKTDALINSIRDGHPSRLIGQANLEALRERVRELDAITEELKTLNTINDWQRISILNYKKSCIRKDFEPFVTRPDKYNEHFNYYD